MSDDAEAEASVSDDELDDDFVDFDPLAGSEDDGVDPPVVEEGESDDETEDKDDEDDESARSAVRRARRTDLPQIVGTRQIIVVAPEDRQTSNVMTLAETTRAIALRAKQISIYPYAYTDVGDLSEATKIARKELFDRKSPLKLERRVGRTSAGESIIEVWTVREMAYPPLN